MSRNGYLAAAALLLLACAATPAAPPGRVAHVVVIVVDGLQPGAIEAAGTRHLRELAARGARTATARAVELPETLPSMVTLATGVAPSVHGVTWNDDRGSEPARPTIFTRASEEGLRTGLYFGKSKLAIVAPRGSADVRFGPGPGRGVHLERGGVGAVAAQFAADFPRERYGLALVHLREPDQAGHAHGWMSEPYLAAVRAVDDAVGTVLGAIEASGRAGQTAVLLTADHGGEGISHDAHRTELSFLVPVICHVPGRKAGNIRDQVTLADIAPTVLALLGLPPLPDSAGTPIKECL
jgi:arylsulfatase A-like enzyme